MTDPTVIQDAADTALYLDASALAKLYVPEPESDRLDAFLRGRRDLLISDLAVTEVLSAVSRKRREYLLSVSQAAAIREALLLDADSGCFRRLELSPQVHRQAERLLMEIDAVALRTLDALHVALALDGAATHIATYDVRMRAASLHVGIKAIDP